MLRLKELRFRAIGRFVEEQHIVFDELGNLIQVDGKNNNTGGSSGAAKSTIFNALEFLFGLNSVPNTILQSRLTDEQMTVEGIFELDGQSLIITRGKKLKIEFAGEVTTGSAKIAEEKLDQILSIPRNLFRPMLHKRQGEKGFFLNFTPKETNDFLTDCLGLSRFKTYLEILDTKLFDLSKLISSTQIELESQKVGIETIQKAKESLGPEPKPIIDREIIIKLKEIFDFSSKELAATIERHQNEQSKLIRPETIILPFDDSALKSYDKEISSIQNELNRLEKEEMDRLSLVQKKIFEAKNKISDLKSHLANSAKAKEEVIKLNLEIKKIRENLCPTCEQVWNTDSAKQKDSQLTKQVDELKAIILSTQNHSVEIEVLEHAIAVLVDEGTPRPIGVKLHEKLSQLSTLKEEEKIKQQIHYQLQNNANKVKQAAFDNKLLELTKAQSIEIEKIKEKVSRHKRDLEQAIYEFKSYGEQKQKYDKMKMEFLSQETALQEKRYTTISKLEQFKRQIFILEELKKAIKGFLSVSFDDALDTIGEYATRLVRNIPNMSNATIQLIGIKETKEGKIKEEVNAVLSLDGDENIDIRSLCGGERSAIDLAVDLSVIELIENKTNKGINLFILDEPFTGMDSIGIEMSLEVLRNSCQNKRIIVVDHNPEVKQMVESKLLVVRDGSLSKIIQN